MGFTVRRPGRGFAFITLAVLLGLSALALTQCRMVNDSVTGVDLKAASSIHGKSTCVQACNEAYKACERAEDEVHKARKADCKQYRNTAERHECIKREQRRHQEAHLGCVRDKNSCKKSCYDEGSGGGGR